MGNLETIVPARWGNCKITVGSRVSPPKQGPSYLTLESQELASTYNPIIA
jgi:hypothetical protein